MKKAIIIICLIFCSAFFAFELPLSDVPDAKKVDKTPHAIKAGLAIYANKCKICHENTEIDMTKKTYTQMMPLLASMVNMEKLSKKEIGHVAAYVYSVSKK